MAKKHSDVNRSEQIRAVLKANPDMKPKVVVDTLAKQGINVQASLVYFVKGQIQGRKGKKKKKGTGSSSGTNGTINKSEEIRKVLRKDPSLTAKEVVAELAKTGTKVSENLVYLVKGQRKGRQHRKEKVQTMVAKVEQTTGKTDRQDAVSIILKVKHLASEVGGMDHLKALVEALGQ